MRSEEKSLVPVLSICWEDLEIDPFASQSHRGKGIGRMLVEACMEEARELNIAKVFLLTYQEEFLGSVDLLVDKKNCHKYGQIVFVAQNFLNVMKLQ